MPRKITNVTNLQLVSFVIFILKKFQLLPSTVVTFGLKAMKHFNITELFICYAKDTNISFWWQTGFDSFDMNVCIFST